MASFSCLGRGLAGVLLAGCSAAHCQSVATTAELGKALIDVRAGAVVRLAPGEYSPVTVQNFHGQATITSADPSRKARLTGLSVTQSSGLTFRDLEFVAPLLVGRDFGFPFSVMQSKMIVLDHLDVHTAPGGTLANEGTGLLIRESQHVTVSDSDFHDLHHGIAHIDDDAIEIRRNHLHHLFDDGIRGGGSSDVVIDGNHCDSQHSLASDTDHPDCIQFWTAGETAAAHDIVITNNTYERGEGSDVQGIFMGDERHLGWNNITIKGNVLRGSMYNGIYVVDAKSVDVEDNLVCGFPDRISWIFVSGSSDVRVLNNKANEFKLTDDAGLRRAGNKVTGRCEPQTGR